MKKLPYMKWYPADWLSDEAVRRCSLAARGLWIDMLSLMHKCDRRGSLSNQGQPYTVQDIARLAGCSVDEVRPLLQELINSGAASVSDDGCYYSRRMIREERKRAESVRYGKLGGNPNLRGLSPPDNPTVASRYWCLAALLLPEGMQGEDVRLAWTEWELHRMEIGHPLTERAARKAMKIMKTLGLPRALDAIDHSIGGGYRGIFEGQQGARRDNGKAAQRAEKLAQLTKAGSRDGTPVEPNDPTHRQSVPNDARPPDA